MKNILIWGFVEGCNQIGVELKKSKVLNVGCWIGLDPKLSDYHLADLIWEPRHAIPFSGDAENVYEKVHNQLAFYINMHSRVHKKHLHKNYFDFLDEFNRYFNFFFKIIKEKKINAIVFANLPHEGPDIILYNVAKAMNLTTLMFYQALFQNKIFYIYDITDFGDFKHMHLRGKKEKYKIEKKFEKSHFYMKNITPYKYSLNDLRKEYDLIEVFKKIRQKDYYKITEYFLNPVKYIKVKLYKNNLNQIIVETVDFSAPYIYFPLHMQPELTTTALGGMYNDQILAIEKLANFIPSNYFIYIKENPKQTEYQRGKGFFERLKSIPKIRLVSMDTNTFDLIRNSAFVATISGSVGWEAVTGGKNVLIFGNAWYQNLPGAFKYSSKLSFEDILKYKIVHEELEDSVGDLYARLPSGIVNSHYSAIYKEFDPNENGKLVAKLIEELVVNAG